MTMKVFSVYDSKVEAYMPPFFMKTKGEAIRAWIDLVKNPQSTINQHPEDFTLFEIAHYDEQSGRFENQKSPISHGVAIEFLAKRETAPDEKVIEMASKSNKSISG